MSNVYSVNFIRAHEVSGIVAYTVPDGYTAIVRDVDLFCGNQLVAPTCYMTSATPDTWFYAEGASETSQWFGWRGRQVFGPGETFGCEVTDGNFDVSVNGYLLTEP